MIGRQKRVLRQRSRRRYENVVAWIVVPPVLIALIYAGLELYRQFAGSPVVKLFGG
jgi:hypothetical protein